jgi:hypothetical protein
MSRSLILAAATALFLTACTTAPRNTTMGASNPSSAKSFSSVEQWLQLQQDVMAMSTDEIVVKRVRVNTPEGVGQLYYYGLLNHQLQTYGAWTQARDTFRNLQQDETLTEAQRQLLVVLEAYNQNRINWYQRQSEAVKQNRELEQRLSDAEQEKLLLEQKIQALTDLEAVISTRKEQ